MQPQTNPPTINRALMAACPKRFAQVNQARLQRTLESLTPRQQSCLLMIPVLLHINHPLLPGYISQQTPAGIVQFEPSEQQIRIAENLVRSLDLQNRAIEEHAILHLSFMGSCGTVAQNRQSDLDFWVCYQPDLPELRLQELRQKLIAIEEWALGVDLEVHFFPMNAVQFRQGGRNAMSGEDCGSAQHYLLLDEFYRTAVMLGGQPPAWWWVPVEQEGQYDAYLKLLAQQQLLDLTQVIDLGPVPTIPAGEFIGAGLWQLYKGIDSPYKSVIKILLAEIYAAHYPKITCLSHHFKQKIYNDILELDKLDPYLMLYQTIEDYLIQQQDFDRLEIARRCFYFKTGEKLSQKPTTYSLPWRLALLTKLAIEWQWNQHHLDLLDHHDEWDIQQISEENKILTHALTHSYQIISEFAKAQQVTVLISETDMQVLNNKLSAAFEQKAHKIAPLCATLSQHLLKENLTLVQQTHHWLLYPGHLLEKQLDQHLQISQHENLVSLLAWCYLNHLVDNHTRLHVISRQATLQEKEASSIVQHLTNDYSASALNEKSHDFHQAAYTKKLSWFINIEKTTDHSKYGLSTISDTMDALSYSVHNNNLVESIDILSANSWGEIQSFRFSDQHPIVEAVLDLLNRWLKNKTSNITDVEILCFTSAKAEVIIRRLKQLVKDLIHCFLTPSFNTQARYLLKVEKIYYVFYIENQQVKVKKCASETGLIKYLSIAHVIYQKTYLDPYSLQDNPLPIIYTHHQQDTISIFYQKNMPALSIYLLDQYGNLLHLTVQQRNVASYLAHLARFIYLAIKRQWPDLIQPSHQPIRFYEMATSKKDNTIQLTRKALQPQADALKYYEVQIVLNPQATAGDMYRIYCGEHIFTQATEGDHLFKVVAQHILAQRKDPTPYPIYITDLMIENSQQAFTITQLLQLKLALEKQLNQSLKS